MRTRRCTPVSPVSKPYAFSPVNWMVADLIPASSPGVSSSTVVLMPLRSAQRRYMRSRIEAVLRFRSTSARFDSHDGVEVIAFAGEKRVGLEFPDVAFRAGKFAVQIFNQIIALFRVGFFLRQPDIRLYVARNGRQLRVRSDLLFGAFAIAQNGLRFLLLAPEVGLCDAGF